jgi:hypothetical protein
MAFRAGPTSSVKSCEIYLAYPRWSNLRLLFQAAMAVRSVDILLPVFRLLLGPTRSGSFSAARDSGPGFSGIAVFVSLMSVGNEISRVKADGSKKRFEFEISQTRAPATSCGRRWLMNGGKTIFSRLTDFSAASTSGMRRALSRRL